jgi:hypothetical protein
MLFFENGNPTQPRYFASMPGIPESKLSLLKSDNAKEANKISELAIDGSRSKYKGGSIFDGFKDPDGVYPKNERLDEPDLDRLARGVTDDTYVEEKNANLDTGVSKAGGGTWDEPQSAYNARYPENIVFNTHGGVVVELDSTQGSKRFSIWHPSNSYVEVDDEGVLVIRNESDSYEIVVKGKNIHIKQDKCETIDGDEAKKVEGDVTEEVGGDVESQVDGNVTENIDGNLTVTVGGNITITSTGNTVVNAPLIQLVGSSVQSGIMAAVKTLMTSDTIALYNSHTHWYDPPGGGPRLTFVPNQLLDSSHATSETEAS